jgi:hypothetical protein
MFHRILPIVFALATVGIALADEPKSKPAERFTANAALDEAAFERAQQIQFLEREAANIATDLREAEKTSDYKSEKLRRDLARIVGQIFEQQQAQYRAENAQLRKRVAAVEAALSKRDGKQEEIVQAKVEKLLSDNPQEVEDESDPDKVLRQMFQQTLELAVLRQRFHQLQLKNRIISNLPNMSYFRQEYGLTVRVEVTGSSSGGIWGTDTYSDDSDIATAAVHAGLLKEGERGLLDVKMVPAPEVFTGSTRHGVTSNRYSSWPSGYVLKKADKESPLPKSDYNSELVDQVANRGLPGDRYTMKITGNTTGKVWGTDIYTSDSDYGAAAVHAGLLKDGETATLTFILVRSPGKHRGSTKNSVTSEDYGPFFMSYVIQKPSKE